MISQTKEVLNPHCSNPILIKKKCGKWSVRLKYRDCDGKRQAKDFIAKLNSLGKVSDKREYAKLLIKNLEDMLKVQYFNPETRRFEKVNQFEYPVLNFLEDFYKHSRTSTSPGTIEDYKRVFVSFATYLTNTGKQDLELQNVDKFLIYDYLDNHLLTTRAVAKSTRDYHLGVLKIYFNYLTDIREILHKNPTKSIKKVNKAESAKHKPYEDNQFKALLDYTKAYSAELWVLMIMQYYTLSRPTELLRLQRKDFDLENRKIHFVPSNTKTDIGKVFFINDAVHQLLLSLDVDWDAIPPESFFLGNTGKPYKRGSKTRLGIFNPCETGLQIFQNKFYHVKKKLKLDKNYTQYGIKHTGAIKLISELKVEPLKVMQLTGHKHLSTFQIYIRELMKTVDASIVRNDIVF